MTRWNLETSRCILRPAQPTDLPYLVSAIRSPAFPARLPLAQMHTDEQLAQWLQQMCHRTAAGTAVCLSVDSRVQDTCIGQVSLAPKPDSSAWNLAFWVHPSHWGHGIATEAVSRAIRAVFETSNCTVIHAGVAHWNRASIRTIERLHFRHVGENPAGYFVAGAPEPIHEYEFTRERWQSTLSNAAP